MNPDIDLIERFEKSLDPAHPESSPIKANVLGYGEISTVFEIDGLPGLACKRMPLFTTVTEAEKYQDIYRQYCQDLAAAGLHIAQSRTHIVSLPDKPVTLYIIQEKLDGNVFAHKLIHTLKNESSLALIESVILEIIKINKFNQDHYSSKSLALDGQLSNWAKHDDQLLYIDTSTPMFRNNGVEQLNPELFLKSAPSFLRWIIRLFFLRGVMERYYDLRLIFIDLAANLYKEKREDLIPKVLLLINQYLDLEKGTITEKEIADYYREDKLIWRLFLSFRRFDRWLRTRILMQNYAYILPGRISR